MSNVDPHGLLAGLSIKYFYAGKDPGVSQEQKGGILAFARASACSIILGGA